MLDNANMRMTTKRDLADAGFRSASRTDRSVTETLLIDRETLDKWQAPPFQRPVRINAKVRELAEELKANGGVIKGTIEIGVIEMGPERGMYLCDGRHRMEGFILSGMGECIADVSFKHYDNLADMAVDFVELNTRLVNFQPDDILRAFEASSDTLSALRERCPYIGYGNIRRNIHSPILSMSAVLKQWYGSSFDTPSVGRITAAELVKTLNKAEVEKLAEFMGVAHSAWGHDTAYARLWLALNLTLCMWLWRKLVLDTERTGNRRYAVMGHEQFKRCLMALSADGQYLDWLVGRMMGERDRAPCYSRIRLLFAKRAFDDGERKIRMPQPAWSTGWSGH